MPASSGPRWWSAAAMERSACREGVCPAPRTSTMPAMPHMASDLLNGLDQQGARVQVLGGAALGLDVLEHALHLLGGELDGGRDLGRGHAMVVRVEAEVHAVVGQGEVELLLRLLHREGVGGG